MTTTPDQPSVPPTKAFASMAEAAEFLGISQSTAYRLAREETFPVPVVRVGNALRVPWVALHRFAGLAA